MLGRFMQEDAYRGDGLDLYAYCADDPVMYHDPSGRNATCDHAADAEENAQRENVTKEETQGPGTWEKANGSMSDASRDYQKFVTEAEDGMVYKVKDVKFDGYKDGILIEAKADYSNFIDKQTGMFKKWFSGKDPLVSQAARQEGFIFQAYKRQTDLG